MISKYQLKVGDKVKYEIPYSDGTKGDFVRCEVREEAEHGNFPAIELNNGHTARWNGKRYCMEDMGDGNIPLKLN